MNRIDDKLIDLCRRIDELSTHVDDWVDNNDDMLGVESDAVHKMVRQLRDRIATLQNAVAARPCIGIIGPGQSGKTHLIAGLAGRGPAPLAATFDGQPTAINYIGGICGDTDHRSGVVSRFTTSNDGTPTKFPVAVELLSQVEIITILATSYFSGTACGTAEIPTPGEVEELANRLGRHLGSSTVAGLSAADITVIRDHLECEFAGSQAVRALSASGYWSYCSAMIPRLSHAGRTALLSVLWGGEPLFTALYDNLIGALEELGHERQAYCALTSLCIVNPLNGEVRSRPDSILNIKPLFRFGKKDDETVLVRSKHGAWAAIRRSVLAMLVAEVRIYLADAETSLLEQADILEFPGMQPGQGAHPLAETTLSPAGLSDSPASGHRQLALFAGHKAAHLFERYHACREITCLVACADAARPDLSNWSKAVTSWVGASLGATPSKRERLETGLFLVLTKTDSQILAASQGKASSVDWTAHLRGALVNGIGRGQDWPLEWTPGRAFDNVFLLRSPHHNTSELCDYLSNGMELCIKSGRAGDVAAAGDVFFGNADVQCHVADPHAVWREMSEPGDGGISYLSQHLSQLCRDPEKHRQIAAEITRLRAELGQRLQRFYVSDDMFAQYDARQSTGQFVLRAMQHCNSNRAHGRLLRLLNISESEISALLYDLNTNPYRDNASYEPPVLQTAEGALKSLTDSLRMIAEDGGQADNMRSSQANNDQAWKEESDQSARDYAHVIVRHWVAMIRGLANAAAVEQLCGLEASAFASLVDELLTAAARHDLETRIAKAIEGGLTKHAKMATINSRAAMVAAEVIGQFINCLGFDENWAEHHPRRSGRARTIIFPPRQDTSLAALEDVRTTLAKDFTTDWSIAYLAMVEDNAEYLRRTRFDLDEDRQLGALLGQLLPSEVWPVFRSSL